MTWTEIGLVAIGAAALVLELVALVLHDQLISPAMRYDGALWLTFPATLGCLVGHFWGPALSWAPRWGAAPALILAGCILARDLWSRVYAPAPASPWLVFAVALLAIPFGWVLWNQGAAR